jgi:hypothetical protein
MRSFSETVHMLQRTPESGQVATLTSVSPLVHTH